MEKNVQALQIFKKKNLPFLIEKKKGKDFKSSDNISVC